MFFFCKRATWELLTGGFRIAYTPKHPQATFLPSSTQLLPTLLFLLHLRPKSDTRGFVHENLVWGLFLCLDFWSLPTFVDPVKGPRFPMLCAHFRDIEQKVWLFFENKAEEKKRLCPPSTQYALVLDSETSAFACRFPPLRPLTLSPVEVSVLNKTLGLLGG